MTKDAIKDGMLLLLLSEIVSWTNFVSWKTNYVNQKFIRDASWHNSKTALVSPNLDKIRLERKIDYKDL